MRNQNTSATLKGAISTSQELLTTYAFSDELLGDLTTAFGSEYNRDAAADLVTQWQTGDFSSFPEVEIRSSAEINGANGAYSVDTNKIYIAEEYLLANADNINAVSDVVLEEYGHYVDARINSVDAAGDEGDIFSGLVRGESFTDEQLQELKLENDQAVITLDGQEIAIEQVTKDGTGGNDTLYGHGGNSNDLLRGYGGNDILKDWSGNDKLHGYSGNDTLNAGWGEDYLSGGDGFDKLYGEGDRDILHGGNHSDELYGGNGDDLLYGDYHSSEKGEDRLYGEAGDDKLYGGNYQDTLDGGNGNDTLYGGNHSDLLLGGKGNDYLDGGASYDRTVYAGNSTEFDITILDDGRIQVQDTNTANGDEGTDILSAIEVITFGDGRGYNVVTENNGNIDLTPRYEVAFSSTGQSTWGSGNSTQIEGDWEAFRPVKWDKTINKKLSFLEFGGGTKGDFHLNAGYEIDSGTIDSTLPFNLVVDAPDTVSVGNTVTISTDYSLSDTASFTTTTPHISAYLDLGAELYLGAYVGADLGILGNPRHNINLVDIDYSKKFEFDTRKGSSSVTFGDFADFTLTSPDIAVKGVQTTDNKLSGSAEDVFLSTEISLDDLIVEKFLKESKSPHLKAMGYAWQNEVNLGIAGFSWDLLDLDVVGDISIETSYDLTFDGVDGTLILEDGTTQAFTPGEDISVDFLTGMDTNGNGQLDYDLQFDLNNPQLNTDVDLVFDLDFDVAALKANGWYDVWFTSGSKDFGPLYQDSFDLARGSIDIYEDTFDLNGFNTESIDDLAIAIV